MIVFLVGMSTLSLFVCNMKADDIEQKKTIAKLNAMTYSERMETDLQLGIGIADELQQILISNDGELKKFDKVAENMMTSSIQSIQIAPDGIVTDIYPEKGNEAGKIDLIHDKDRGKISRYGRDNHVIIMQGPFELKQGGSGIAVRNPLYLSDNTGKEYFWGFTIVVIKVPDIFSDSIKALTDFGYNYALYKTVSPWENRYEVVYSSGEELMNPVSYEFSMYNTRWKMEVTPKQGWENSSYLHGIMVGGTVIVLLLTGLTAALLELEDKRKKFKKRSITDSLTQVYNRSGFDEMAERYMKQNPEKPCVAAQFDIDDFKMINDMYGHSSGDKVLKNIADSMKNFFPENAILGRSGGDEFCIFLPDHKCGEASNLMEQFTSMKRTFDYRDRKISYSISLGYSEYPKHSANRSNLMRCADMALYEAKMRGKNDCMAYKDGMEPGIRNQLGFALKDISENLPGSFIIYKADKKDDEILFANHEMIRLTGCENMEELQKYTGRSFRNLIRVDEQKAIEDSIWSQIEDGNNNDYIYFHMKKADGTFLRVLDHGRIVESPRYGRVFYVLIMDWQFMQDHYKESFQN